MNIEEFQLLLNEAFENNQLSFLLNEKASKQLFSLAHHLLDENRKYNLTAIKTYQAIIYKHFVDSLLIENVIPRNSSIIDIGCGAGFPSLPLAIARPDLRITSIDSNSKKITFINSCLSILGVNNITTITSRAEDAAHNTSFRDNFDFSVARAVSSLPVLIELCTPFLKPGGLFLAMKGPEGIDDFKKLNKNLHALNVGDPQLMQYNLDTNSAIEARSIIIIKKLGKTPDNFPRNYAQITRKPLE